MARSRRAAKKKRPKPRKPLRSRKPRTPAAETSGLSTKVRAILDRTRAAREARDVFIAGVDISGLGPTIEFTGPKRNSVLSRFKFQGTYADDKNTKKDEEDKPDT